VRHALKPYTTVIICEDGIKTFPFDVNHVAEAAAKSAPAADGESDGEP
jgi:hypothetical protein